MNNKERDLIGYYLSELKPLQDSERGVYLINKIAQIDEKLKDEFASYSALDNDQAIVDRYGELMEQKHGRNWPLLIKSKGDSKEIWEQAEQEINEQEQPND